MLNGLKKIFNKKSSTSKFGIALRRQVGSYAVVDKSTSTCQIDEFFTETTDSAGDWLEELLSSHTFSGRGTLVLSSSHFHSVQIDKPDLPDDEISAALKWLVKDIVPIEPEDMVVDYSDSPVVVAGTQKINVVCANLSHLKKFTDSFKRYQVKLSGITTDEFAFANLVKASEKPTLLLCQQPFEDLLLLIIVNGQIYLSRRLRGFNEIGGYSQEQLMNGICDSLSIELQKSLDYFERQLKQAPVTSIQVILPVVHEDFIVERLNANANIKVEKLVLDTDFAQHRHCAASVGAIVETSIREAQQSE
ncbi:hypothetical protein [Thalassomonas sp. M1454]|uniref:hypothetical protein n=1 Tax=Thalassomonas sp. M1454 TaxID=2594477 RepID=UPI001180A01E|nr:hypothetical protein [Thalassomonas sp. M1454]TRX52815.1 hypothetical protein FNN08_15770 [Thalassomonas sp. M1454]